MRSELAIFHAKTVSQTESGVSVTDKDTNLWVDEKSVSNKEFYAAYQSGLNPQIVLEVYPPDYDYASAGTQLPTEVTYQGTRYKIIRTYKRNNSLMEVVLGL